MLPVFYEFHVFEFEASAASHAGCSWSSCINVWTHRQHQSAIFWGHFSRRCLFSVTLGHPTPRSDAICRWDLKRGFVAPKQCPENGRGWAFDVPMFRKLLWTVPECTWYANRLTKYSAPCQRRPILVHFNLLQSTCQLDLAQLTVTNIKEDLTSKSWT